MTPSIDIGVLVSGGGSNLQAILDACDSGAISGRVSFVGSDNPGAFGLERAKKQHIPTFVVDYGDFLRRYRENPETFPSPRTFNLEAVRARQVLFDRSHSPDAVDTFLRSRAVVEDRLLAEIRARGCHLLVLAGFMRKLTPFFIDAVNQGANPPKIMNIHPALLPAFPGEDGYGDTYRYGCKIGGCTVHFVDYGEDSGPIIGQKAFPIHDGDTLEAVKDRGLKLEWELYPECIQLFAENRLRVENRFYDLGKGRRVSRAVVLTG